MLLKGKYILLLTWVGLEAFFSTYAFSKRLVGRLVDWQVGMYVFIADDRPTLALWLCLHLRSVLVFTKDHTPRGTVSLVSSDTDKPPKSGQSSVSPHRTQRLQVLARKPRTCLALCSHACCHTLPQGMQRH